MPGCCFSENNPAVGAGAGAVLVGVAVAGEGGDLKTDAQDRVSLVLTSSVIF